jgi:hypothetical protein
MTNRLEEPIDLTYLANLIESKKPTCLCGKALRGSGLREYDHDGGFRTLDSYGNIMEERQWIYVHCSHCGYDMALHKIARELNED